jgi:hypothetical protein
MAEKITYRKVYADGSSRVCCEHVRHHEVESFIASLVTATPDNPRVSESDQPFWVCEVRAQ